MQKKIIFRLVLSLGTALTPGGFSAESNVANRELKYEEPRHLSGRIYSRGAEQKHLLFNFQRVATRSGSTLDVQRDYTYPDGKLAAREHVVYQGDNLVLFELEERQIGASGRAKIQRDPANANKGIIEFEYTKNARDGNKPSTGHEILREDTLVNDMVGPFLISHWDALARGDKVKCRYIVLSRRETVGFTFVKESESEHAGKVMIIKMEATSPFVATLVEPLYFTIEKAPPHRVLQYIGRTTPKIQVNGQWKDLDAVTVFDW